MRLDLYLTEKKYFTTRNQSQNAIKEKRIIVDGKIVDYNNFDINDQNILEILKKEEEYVSRGGYKLAKAINFFNLDFKEKIVLDLGSSTGGFTDCALKHGAKKVIAIDVGTNQMVIPLRNDPRVELFENTNVKTMNNVVNSMFFDFILCDVSFISITKLLEYIIPYMDEMTSFICLIKPQFEVNNQNINNKGVVKDPKVHCSVLNNVIDFTRQYQIFLQQLTFSPLLGEKSGNIEYLMLLSKKKPLINIKLEDVVNQAFKNLKKN